MDRDEISLSFLQFCGIMEKKNPGRTEPMEEFTIQEAENRIRQMEHCFDLLLKAEKQKPREISGEASLKERLELLNRYYESGQWLRDYELDEQGLLPKELKRGVLSQDAVFNFLDRLKHLQNSEVQDEPSIDD